MLLVPDTRELTEVLSRQTGRRIRELRVELQPGRIVLRGRAVSYHVKQLAQHGLRRLLPHDQPVDNAIVVEPQ